MRSFSISTCTRICVIYKQTFRQIRLEGPKSVYREAKQFLTSDSFQNIRIMSMYYTRITVKRMSQLLGLSESETEDALSQLVVSTVVRAKIDRPAGVVHFR